MTRRSIRALPARPAKMGIPAQPAIVSSLMLKARSGLSGDHMGMVEFDAANGPVLKYQELELDPSGNGVDEYIRKGDFE